MPEMAAKAKTEEEARATKVEAEVAITAIAVTEITGKNAPPQKQHPTCPPARDQVGLTNKPLPP